jgi:hypothetical protein
VIERREVGELDHQSSGDDPVGVGIAQLGGEQHQQRAEALAAGVQQVPRRLGDERGVGAHRSGEACLDLFQPRANAVFQGDVGERQSQRVR